MERNNSIDRALDQIRGEHITPRPRWEFMVENIFKWILSVLSGIIGALFLVFMFNVLGGTDWDLRMKMKLGIWKLVLLILPPVWVIFLIVSVVLAYLLFRSTRYGYRYSGTSASLIVLGVIAVVGVVSFFLKADKLIGNRMPNIIPGYGQAALIQEQLWSHPENGLLGGEIVRYEKNNNMLMVRDSQGAVWAVTLNQNIKIPKPIQRVMVDKRVKIVGEKTGELQFQARELRPWNERFQIPMAPNMPGPRRPMMQGGIVPPL